MSATHAMHKASVGMLRECEPDGEFRRYERIGDLTVSAPDRHFATWATRGLMWLPERGMGFLPVSEQTYDDAYFAKYAEYADTSMGRTLSRLRVDLVTRHAPDVATVCDVGIGCGAFIDAMPRTVYGHDVNPAGVRWLRSRGLCRDPREKSVDALTFWDSIEHIPAPAPLLAGAREWVFASLPIVPGDGPPSPDWRHYRPDEHCWYWTRAGFIGWMDAHGFECVEHNTGESIAGRQDIGTFAFRRRS